MIGQSGAGAWQQCSRRIPNRSTRRNARSEFHTVHRSTRRGPADAERYALSQGGHMANDAKARLQYPAICLILVGTINPVSGLLVILSTIMNLAKGPTQQVLENPDRLLGYQTWIVTSTLGALITIIASPLIIYGAVQMLGARKYSMAKLAAILSLIPCTSLCCVLGIPAGIWGLVVLNKPEVKAAFNNSQGSTFGPRV